MIQLQSMDGVAKWREWEWNRERKGKEGESENMVRKGLTIWTEERVRERVKKTRSRGTPWMIDEACF